MSDPNIIPKQERPLPRQRNIAPVGDLFAPFFDVVFYAPSEESGVIARSTNDAASTKSEDANSQDKAAAAQRQAASKQAAQRRNLDDTTSIGQGSIALRSIGGGTQNFEPSSNAALAHLVNYRANLQVTMLSAAAVQATLTLNPPYEAAIEIVDNKLIKFGSLMEIQWGYLALDGGTPAISDKGLFRITQPSIKFGSTTTVTIGGFDILSGSLRTADTRCQWLRSTYKCDLDIIRKIVTTRVAAGAKIDDRLVGKDSPLRRRKPGKSVIQSDDDWTFFRRILRQNDVAFVQVGATIFLIDERRIDIAEPRYRLLWYKQPENEKDIPMKTFETNAVLSLFQGAAGTRGQRTICRDPVTKKVTVIDKDPGKTGVPQAGAKNTRSTEKGYKKAKIKTSDTEIAPFANLDKACTSGRVFTQPCKRPNQKEETDRENREMRRFFNTRASAICPGVPGMIPQTMTRVEGVGKTFCGNYRVMKVVHNIGQGYTMNIDLLRGAEVCETGQGATASTDPAGNKKPQANSANGEPVSPTVLERVDQRTTLSGQGCVDQAATNEARRKADEARRAVELTARVNNVIQNL